MEPSFIKFVKKPIFDPEELVRDSANALNTILGITP